MLTWDQDGGGQVATDHGLQNFVILWIKSAVAVGYKVILTAFKRAFMQYQTKTPNVAQGVIARNQKIFSHNFKTFKGLAPAATISGKMKQYQST